jgi:thiamine-phosphate pyrophosphorylase
MVDFVFHLNDRHLYLCVPHREDLATFLPAVLRGGVDVVQLREKDLDDETRIADATIMVAICHEFGVPFIMNDSPELALRVGADGVHVGQDDVRVSHCREVLGYDAIVGLSTHSAEEFDEALDQMATYFSAGPIVATPTKPGRTGTGIDYAIASQARSDRPVFVTGGVSDTNIADLVAVGLRHFVVVRALTEASEPEAAARNLRDALDAALSAVPVEPT